MRRLHILDRNAADDDMLGSMLSEVLRFAASAYRHSIQLRTKRGAGSSMAACRYLPDIGRFGRSFTKPGGLRDARVLAFYEGTAAMQVHDLIRRRWRKSGTGYETFVAAVRARNSTRWRGPLMKYLRFGQTGLKVSQLCLGTMSMGSSAWKGWVLDENESIPILRRALDAGITFFDMADWYSTGRNEEVVCKNLLSMSERERLVLATKVFYPMSDDPNDRGLSRKHISNAIDRSLARMRTDYVDLYVIHAFDTDSPIEETMEALHDTVRAGKVRYLGASTMYAWQFARMNHAAELNGWTPFVNMQCQYNLIYREEEREMFPYCKDRGIAVTTFSPLARGFLARRAGSVRTTHDPYQDFYGDAIDCEIVRRVDEVATRRGVSRAHVAMAWVGQNSNQNIPIVGAGKTAHVDVAVDALTLDLDTAEREFLEAPYRPRDEISDQKPVRRPRALHLD